MRALIKDITVTVITKQMPVSPFTVIGTHNILNFSITVFVVCS